MPRLFGERVMLREYRQEDLASMRKWVNDPEIVDCLSDLFLHAHSLRETERFLDMAMAGEDERQKNFVIADRQTEEYIGQIDLIHIDWKNSTAAMGIVLGRKELLGQGFGTEAVKLLQYFVFERLNMHRLELDVHDYNERAYRCYLTCGFVEEGRQRQKFFIHGRYTDVIQMAILRAEYELLKSSRIVGKR